MAPLSDTRLTLLPRASVSALALISMRPSLLQLDSLLFALSLPYLRLKTSICSPSTSPMHLLMGDLEEEVFMEQPEGFEQGEPGQVLCLKRSLYGLKQASRMWYQKLQTVLIDIGFHCVEVDSSIYVFTRETLCIIMPVFVNDITVKFSPGTSEDNEGIKWTDWGLNPGPPTY